MNSAVQRHQPHAHNAYFCWRSVCTHRESEKEKDEVLKSTSLLRCCVSIYFSMFFARESSSFSVSVRVSVSAFSLSYLSHILLCRFFLMLHHFVVHSRNASRQISSLSVLLNPSALLHLYIRTDRRRTFDDDGMTSIWCFSLCKRRHSQPIRTALDRHRPTRRINMNSTRASSEGTILAFAQISIVQ